MDKFDEYTFCLLEESKRFLEKAKVEKDMNGQLAYLHSSLLLSICFIEAIVNGIASEFEQSDVFSLYERSFLCEKEMRIDHGVFILTSKMKMQRLLDKIDLIVYRFSNKKINHAAHWWDFLNQGIKARNNLVHPKAIQDVTFDLVSKTLVASIECANVIFKAVYRRQFPKTKKGLSSVLSF